MNTFFLWAALVMGLAGLGLAFYYARLVLAASQGNELMIEISSNIRAGAMAFLRREYTWVAVFVAAMFLLIGLLLDDGWLRALAYL
ncbi:MAG: sodium/proton-translocating pyrophosphatase, partial [Acidimicrobiia bacterium]|nr:sodium/proton-translocating pyrophosphatase [Acidimicrobiia bacterium]